MAQRAKWTWKYEKGLVDVLIEYRSSHLRGQNGWSTEGWNRIVKDFNRLFPEAQFSKTKVQDKEAQLKKDYKTIRGILKKSGVSWNHDASMINTTDEIWDEIAEGDPKLRRYEKKSFPLFESLDLLYEGQIAEGKHCFTSSKPPATASKGLEAAKEKPTRLDFTKKNPWTVPINVGPRSFASDGEEEHHSPLRFDEPATQRWDNEEENEVVETQGMQQHSSYQHVKKRSSHQRFESSGRQGLGTVLEQDRSRSINLSDNDEGKKENSDETQGIALSGTARPSRSRSKRRKDTKSVPRIEETMSNFVSFKREQVAAKSQQKSQCQGQEFSMTRCLAVLAHMDDLSDDVKIQASEVFKDDINREIFLGYETRLRGMWLTKEVNKLGSLSNANVVGISPQQSAFTSGGL